MAKGAIAEIEVGETLCVGAVALTVEQKSGRKVRLRIVAPLDMKIVRGATKENGESRLTAGNPA